MGGLDYYQVLGLVPDAEPAVIRAAYRALISIYHPDKNGGAKAAEKARLINAAYDILSDSIKRKEYDASRSENAHNATTTEFESESPFSSTPIDQSWSVATKFYPQIDEEARDLERISWRLSFGFKLELLEGQQYCKSGEVAERIKREYLLRYFGADIDVQRYAEDLIKAGRKDAALYLNQIVNVMGASVSISQIETQVNCRYDDLTDLISLRRIYSSIKSSKNGINEMMLALLIEKHGGTVKNSFFGNRIDVVLEGEEFSFNGPSSFRRFVLERYHKYS